MLRLILRVCFGFIRLQTRRRRRPLRRPTPLHRPKKSFLLELLHVFEINRSSFYAMLIVYTNFIMQQHFWTIFCV